MQAGLYIYVFMSGLVLPLALGASIRSELAATTSSYFVCSAANITAMFDHALCVKTPVSVLRNASLGVMSRHVIRCMQAELESFDKLFAKQVNL